MFCTKCGNEISEGTKFCPKCGTDVSVSTQMKNVVNDVFDSAEAELGEAIQEVQESFSNGEPCSQGSTHLKDDRSLLIYILLSIITLGIYSYYFVYKLAIDVNVACEGDGNKTPGLVAFILLSFVTCGIYSLIWYYKVGNRLAENAPRYGMNFQENGTTVLLWYICGSLLCGIGLFIAMHILIKNTNRICNAYNRANAL